jgi:hypothetical protein
MVKTNGTLGWMLGVLRSHTALSPCTLLRNPRQRSNRNYRSKLSRSGAALFSAVVFTAGLAGVPSQSFAHTDGVEPAKPDSPFVAGNAWISPVQGSYTSSLTEKKTFQEWLRSPRAVITPELAHLGMQLALERSREYLDSFAYEIAKSLIRSLADAFPPEWITRKSATRESAGLARFAALLTKLTEPRWATVPELNAHCTRTLESLDLGSKKQLAVVFGGRMQLAGKETDTEIEQHPIWRQLQQESCQFRGYVAASTRPEVWKFWLSHALLSSVLPTDADNAAVFSLLSKEWKIVESAGKLDTYLSHRGKPVGMSLKAASDLRRDSSDKRTTGKFIGSSAVSLLAEYSSGWADQLQQDFRLESLWAKDSQAPIEQRSLFVESLYKALPSDYPTARGTSSSRFERSEPSAFEIGLVFWWKRIREPAKPPFGVSNTNYSRVVGANWMAAALDGFSSHANWNDALGFGTQSGVEAEDKKDAAPCCTRKIAGPGAIYAVLGYEMESALKAFEPALEVVRRSASSESNWQELRKNWLNAFDQFKSEAFKVPPGVEEVPEEVTRWWKQIEFGTPIASLGVFDVDSQTTQGAPKKVNVQIGRGSLGLISPFSSSGATYDLWVPTSYIIVNFSESPLSAQEWKKLVQERGL